MRLKQERDKTEGALARQVGQLEYELHQAKKQIVDLTERLHATRREQAFAQNEAVLVERAAWQRQIQAMKDTIAQEQYEKEAQNAWQQRFIEASKQRDVIHTPTERTMTKFSQNIAVLRNADIPEVVRFGVMEAMCQMLRESTNDLILGPTFIALVHASIHTCDEGVPLKVSELLVKAGVLPALVCICEQNENAAVLQEALRLFASIALCTSNKSAIVSKQGVRAVVRLLYATSNPGIQPAASDPSVIRETLIALVNMAYRKCTVGSLSPL